MFNLPITIIIYLLTLICQIVYYYFLSLIILCFSEKRSTNFCSKTTVHERRLVYRIGLAVVAVHGGHGQRRKSMRQRDHPEQWRPSDGVAELHHRQRIRADRVTGRHEAVGLRRRLSVAARDHSVSGRLSRVRPV